MAVLTTMAMTIVGLAAAGIYPDGHFDYVTKVTDESQFTDLIKEEVDADINLRDTPIRGDYNPGAGGWPTVRYFNSGTGYGGEPYDKKTSKAMCDELGDEEYMEALVMEKGGVSPCSIEDGEGCSEKEKKYIKKWKEIKTAEDVLNQLSRLGGMQAGKMKPSLMKWIKQRISILRQLAEVEASPPSVLVSEAKSATAHEEL